MRQNDAAAVSTPLILTVPGLANSGPGHWQSLWEQQRGDCRRVELGMWDAPHRNTWVNQLNLGIRAAGRPMVLAAHSLGCLAVAWWAQLEGANAAHLVAGALLVAPPEAGRSAIDHRLAGFAPVPDQPLPFPAILVGSRNDPYMNIRDARRLAQVWGAGFADAGAIGHINAGSNIGDWPFGQFLLSQLLKNSQIPRRSTAESQTRAGCKAGEASRKAHVREASLVMAAEDQSPLAG